MRINNLFLAPLALVFDKNAVHEPHPHRGKTEPFDISDLPGIIPDVTVDEEAQTILASGKQYQTKLRKGQYGQGIVVQDIQAPTVIVWDTILDFDNYKEMVPKTIESEIYQMEELPGGQKRILVRMVVGWPLIKFEVFFDHIYDAGNNALTWTLDYDRKSGFDDSVGFWYVLPHPQHPEGRSRVFYSVQGSMFAWVPGFVVDFMSKQALTDATEWVKEYSESKYVAQMM